MRLTGELSIHRRGTGDPAFRVEAGDAVWRACRPSDGPVTVRLSTMPTEASVVAEAWGPGAGWALEMLPAWLGGDDDPTGFDPQHPVLREGWRRLRHWRVGRTGLVMESLVPAVLEQKVTGIEARRSWRELLRRYGEPAPGPAPYGLVVPPAAETWRRIPSWEWHRAGVGPQRAETVVRAARVAHRMEETTALPLEEAAHRLATVPGIGPWTVAEVMQRAHGDADAVSVGDFHLSNVVGWALLGHDLDDGGMLELLEPYRPHRFRVTRLCELFGQGRPRRGPRYAPRDYRAI